MQGLSPYRTSEVQMQGHVRCKDMRCKAYPLIEPLTYPDLSLTSLMIDMRPEMQALNPHLSLT